MYDEAQAGRSSVWVSLSPRHGMAVRSFSLLRGPNEATFATSGSRMGEVARTLLQTIRLSEVVLNEVDCGLPEPCIECGGGPGHGSAASHPHNGRTEGNSHL